MIQEIYQTHPAVRDACYQSISEHAATIEADIAEAMRLHCVAPSISAASLALYFQAVIQGAFILAKAQQGPAVAADCLDLLRRYIEMLFVPRKQ